MDAAIRKDSAPKQTYQQGKVGQANPITTASDPKDDGASGPANSRGISIGQRNWYRSEKGRGPSGTEKKAVGMEAQRGK